MAGNSGAVETPPSPTAAAAGLRRRVTAHAVDARVASPVAPAGGGEVVKSGSATHALHLRLDVSSQEDAAAVLTGCAAGAFLVWQVQAAIFMVSYVTPGGSEVAHVPLGLLSNGTWFCATSTDDAPSGITSFPSLGAWLASRKYLDASVSAAAIGGSNDEPAPPPMILPADDAASSPRAEAASGSDDIVFHDVRIPPACSHGCQTALFAAVGVAGAVGTAAVAQLQSRLAPAAGEFALTANATMGDAVHVGAVVAGLDLAGIASSSGDGSATVAACHAAGAALRAAVCAVLPDVDLAWRVWWTTHGGDFSALCGIAAAAAAVAFALQYVHTGKRLRVSLSGNDRDGAGASGCNPHRVRWAGAYSFALGLAVAATAVAAGVAWSVATPLVTVENGLRPFVIPAGGAASRLPPPSQAGPSSATLAALGSGALPWRAGGVWGTAVAALHLPPGCSAALAHVLEPGVEAPRLLRVPLSPATRRFLISPQHANRASGSDDGDCLTSSPLTPLRLPWADGWVVGGTHGVVPTHAGIARTVIVAAAVALSLSVLNLAVSEYLAQRRAGPPTGTLAHDDDDD